MSLTDIEDLFVSGSPHPQKVIDMFQGQWSSNLPVPGVVSGTNQLFYDDRIEWFVEQMGSVKNKSIVELGPLEGAHAWMLEAAGVSSIDSIEANTMSYLRCLAVKELTGLSKTHFMLGDFVDFLRETPNTYDICIASGVLYHMQSPVEVIDLISRHVDSVMIWTHYYDEDAIAENAHIDENKFSESIQMNHGGFEHELHQYNYLDALALKGFCGGTARFSRWMTKQTLLDALRHFGFGKISCDADKLDHPNGPCITIAASKG